MPEWNDATAEWYAENYGDYPTNKLAVDELKIRDDSTIVDIGCGTGAALRHAASKIKGGKLIGVDPVPRMIEIAIDYTEKHELENRIEYRVGSAEKVPINIDFAELVFAFDSIDHWQNIDQGLLEIKRILKPDGTLVIVKDKSVPGADKAIKILLKTLESVGFEISVMKEISKEDVYFLLLICNVRN